VPSNTLVRDLAAPAPPYSGQGRRRKTPFTRADAWSAALPEDAWETFEVRDGEKGPLVTQAARTWVQAKEAGKASEAAETLVVFREQQGDGTWKHDYMLSDALAGATVEEFARVYKAEHRVEECLKRAKGEAGLGDYQVRTWKGWRHHQALSLLATWFLTQETRRGKNTDARSDGACGARVDRWVAQPGVESPHPHPDVSYREPQTQTQRGSSPLSLASA
jgi:hypothetical protein